MTEILNTYFTIPLRGVTVLPGMSIYLDMTRPASASAVMEAQKTGRQVFMVPQKDDTVENPGFDQLESFGTVASVKQVIRNAEGSVRVLVHGIDAGELREITQYVPFLVSQVAQMSGEPLSAAEDEACSRELKSQLTVYLNSRENASRELTELLNSRLDADRLSAVIACSLPMDRERKTAYLKIYPQVRERCAFLVNWIGYETSVENFRREHNAKVRQELDKQQRDYILREQMKVIRDELDEGQGKEADSYEEKAKNLDAPEEVKKQLEKEIRRYRVLNQASPEAAVSQNYIENLLAMPWGKRSEEETSIARAKEVLEEDHYGLKKVKEQVLEFLAVRKLQQESGSDALKKGQVLCLVGPPGTGKTSIARSIARALNRKYVRLSLGGVHDEAQIRGHRRTYVAAMPGEIAAALRRAQTMNPLILLDELDKMGQDNFHGNVASAMLEVLDGEQNFSFADHYLDVPLDLSEVLFVATANTVQTIPQPLLDRIEVIEVGSYTEEEKLQIAMKYLVPKQVKNAALPEGLFSVDEQAVRALIRSYTRESGVRALERQIATLCRKAALRYLEEGREKICLTQGDLEEYLGREKYRPERGPGKGEAGIARGLAWTSVGGVTLEIEVNTSPGKGALLTTGKIGDVMKESAQTALDYVKSIASGYGVSDDFFAQNDIHIHIPEGAVPKDGPSAGITLATAILSAVSSVPVRADLAMTGEVTLRGRVLAIGGLKEKLLAAKAAGIFNVLVPEENLPDVSELEEEVTRGMNITAVERMEDVLRLALERG